MILIFSTLLKLKSWSLDIIEFLVYLGEKSQQGREKVNKGKSILEYIG
jgi:hypothetical protein